MYDLTFACINTKMLFCPVVVPQKISHLRLIEILHNVFIISYSVITAVYSMQLTCDSFPNKTELLITDLLLSTVLFHTFF